MWAVRRGGEGRGGGDRHRRGAGPAHELPRRVQVFWSAAERGGGSHTCVGADSASWLGFTERILSAGVHVVVGTPGRVFDMLKRQSLRPDYIKMFVLDEADEIFSRGFKDQVSHGQIRQNASTWFECFIIHDGYLLQSYFCSIPSMEQLWSSQAKIRRAICFITVVVVHESSTRDTHKQPPTP
ncbi:hypothetical protein RJ640_001938 [Escallonia rubra]|uniref:DEAD/DEAH-box helicase domain-containing protein n=1 Tax=Escallonia rubra TaxID=112253 RepID=A0AA88U3H9_9ASTE|nr:hypothetical protein RJ640_001938 [Escallonia rubra]